MLKEFKEFAVKGNVIDMAVGIVIGAAFGTIVKSFVSDIIMPPIGLLLGNVDFSQLYLLLKEGTKAGPYATLADAQAAGAVVLSYGVFINSVISFMIISFSIFIVIKNINKLKREAVPVVAEEPTTKACPYCFSTISIKALKCPNCTSELKAN